MLGHGVESPDACDHIRAVVAFEDHDGPVLAACCGKIHGIWPMVWVGVGKVEIVCGHAGLEGHALAWTPHDIALPRVSRDEVLLALLKATSSKGMVGVAAQDGPPCCRSLFVVAKGVVNGGKVEPSIEMVASAADGCFEI